MPLNGKRILIAVATVGVLFGAAAASFFVGDAYAVGALSVRRVTPDQLAQAMKADEFFSDYREATLLVRGQAASATRGAAGTTLAFQTQVGMTTSCQMGELGSSIHVGDTVTVVTEGADAQRLATGVLLTNCVLAN